MKKKILITGSNGLLGQKLVYGLLNEKDFDVIATSRGENRLTEQKGYVYQPLDLTDDDELEEVLTRYKPHIIINTAAMTNVDACEKDKEACWEINVEAVQCISEICSQIDSHLIHLSTDFIFNGEKGPYREEDEPDPLSFYGKSKLESEKIIMESNLKSTIIRTVLVYGVADSLTRSNIVLWAKGALENNQQINVVDDQFRSPTLAEDLAQGCILAAKKQATGIYNISGRDFMSILELVYKVADFYGLNKSLITPVSSKSLNQPAKRPPKTGFILDKAIKELGYQPHSFEEGLKIVDEQLKTLHKRA